MTKIIGAILGMALLVCWWVVKGISIDEDLIFDDEDFK